MTVCSMRCSKKMRLERFVDTFPTDTTGTLVTTRLFRLLALLLLLACSMPRAHATDMVEITRAYIEASEEGYKLAAT